MVTRYIFLFDEDETYWFSAVSEEAALQMYVKEMGYDSLDALKEDYGYNADDEIQAIRQADDKAVAVRDADGNEPPVSQTAQQWASETEGLIATSAI